MPPEGKSIQMTYSPAIWEKALASVVAVLVFALVGWLVIRNEPFADPNLVAILRIILSVAAAVLGATIPGFLRIDISGKGILVRASGALALFVLTFSCSPNVLPGPHPLHFTVQPEITIKHVDLVIRQIGSPITVKTPRFEDVDIEKEVAASVMPAVLHAITSTVIRQPINTTVVINGTMMTADQPLTIYAALRYSTPEQIGAPSLNMEANVPIDLAVLFKLTENPRGVSDESLKISFKAQLNGSYSQGFIVKCQSSNTFAFASGSPQSQRITLAPSSKIRLLVSDAKVVSATGVSHDALGARFTAALKNGLSSDPSIVLSGDKYDEIIKRRFELKTLPQSDAKVNIIEQFAFDYYLELVLYC